VKRLSANRKFQAQAVAPVEWIYNPEKVLISCQHGNLCVVSLDEDEISEFEILTSKMDDTRALKIVYTDKCMTFVGPLTNDQLGCLMQLILARNLN